MPPIVTATCMSFETPCRLWTGSICLTAVCFPASAVSFLVDSTETPYHSSPPALKSYTSSPGVEGRDEANEKEGVIHVSAGTLKEFKDVKIRSQIFCENLIPGMGVGPVGEGVDMFRTREGRWEVGEENGKEG
ncbi:hypothetical protein K525DRAFT_288749 [Schizophyllum commune Loenen D]|nr:hypothetical protein K525DRAFT_288749 [Schizophyllum commune Loenen D]